MAHLSHDEAVMKVGHPVLWLDSDLGHPPTWCCASIRLGPPILLTIEAMYSGKTDNIGGCVAQYKYAHFLKTNSNDVFDALHEPGSSAPFAGIYRCASCGKEVVSVQGSPLPPQNHHQHQPSQGVIRWQLIVSH